MKATHVHSDLLFYKDFEKKVGLLVELSAICHTPGSIPSRSDKVSCPPSNSWLNPDYSSAAS